MLEVSNAPSALPPELDRSAVRRRFADEFRVRPWIYWTDMVGSAAAAWTLFYLSTQAPLGSVAHLAMTVGAILALLRAALFIHELAHVKRAQLPGFDVVWNALVGVPVLVPGIMYSGSHMDHHRRNGFGTMEDPEYAPIAKWSRPRIALFVLTVAFAPLALVLRWAVLGPLSWLFPPLRKFVVERLSTLGINAHYRRPLPQGTKKVRWMREEAACALFVWGVAAGTALGWIPLAFVGQWFVISAGVLVVNQVRTLAAHGYENEGQPVDSEGQLLDSINLTGWPVVSASLAPVGLRYHALHHYLPNLPYHSLGMVHRQLLSELPADSPYRRTSRDSLLQPVQKLWNATSA
jgi:fatty acid desaturase